LQEIPILSYLPDPYELGLGQGFQQLKISNNKSQ